VRQRRDLPKKSEVEDDYRNTKRVHRISETNQSEEKPEQGLS
jgi:hypothetical protein